MPTEVSQVSGVPCSYESGTTLRFTLGETDFPATLWTAAFVLNNGVDAATSIAGTADGTQFEYVIPASPVLTPGFYSYGFYYTAISPTTEKARGQTGTIEILPSLLATATPSHAQAMVTLLESVMLEFGATTKLSVSFAGQSFTRGNIGDYQRQYLYWKSQLISEQRAAARARGEISDGRITTIFVSAGRGPWPCGC